MIKYARRKKKKDLFVLWLGLSTMTFGIAGATLRGVPAVKSRPVLIDTEPVSIPIEIVDATLPAAIGGDPSPSPEPDSASAPVASRPFESAQPLDLPTPEPLSGVDVDPGDSVGEPEELPAPPEPPVEPEPSVEPIEPEPEPAEQVKPPGPAEELTKPKVQPKAKPKTESRPPAPKREVKPAPKRQSTPPKPKSAPRATPAKPDSRMVVQKPKVIYRPQLRVPEQARRAGIGGSLLLEVRVGTNGRVANIRKVRGSGHRILDDEAVSKVRAWRFEPAKNAYGKAMPYTIQVPVNFGYASAN